jgi:uncharacterized membrane protein
LDDDSCETQLCFCFFCFVFVSLVVDFIQFSPKQPFVENEFVRGLFPPVYFAFLIPTIFLVLLVTSIIVFISISVITHDPRSKAHEQHINSRIWAAKKKAMME